MREQLVTQITLGVASGDLTTGEKLPSRQEIARRFKIHANTVSNAYQELTGQGLIEFKQGSGFYVSETAPEALGEKIELDALITKLFQTAQSLGFSNEEIRESLRKRIDSRPSKSFLVIEPDEALRAILIEEIKNSTGARVHGITLEDFEREQGALNSVFVALADEKSNIEAIVSSDQVCTYLRSSSVPDALMGESRPTKDSLIALVSGWENFLVMAKTILVAANIDADSIIARSTDDENWQRGLESASIIICDSLTAKSFGNDGRTRIFQVISQDSLNEMRNLI